MGIVGSPYFENHPIVAACSVHVRPRSWWEISTPTTSSARENVSPWLMQGRGQDQCKPPAHEVKHTTSQCCNRHHRKCPWLDNENMWCPKPNIRWDFGMNYAIRYQHLSTILSGNLPLPYWNQPVHNQPRRQRTYKKAPLPSNACCMNLKVTQTYTSHMYVCVCVKYIGIYT